MTEALGHLEMAAAADGLRLIQPAAFFKKRHLRRQVISLDHLDWIGVATEADVLRAAIRTGAK